MDKQGFKVTVNAIEWNDLLDRAVNEPGVISKAYSMFHNYSVGNKMVALLQCALLGIEPGPMAGYKRWQELGRQVQRDQRKLYLWVPLKRSYWTEDEETGEKVKVSYVYGFDLRPCVFVMSQTEGDEVEFPEVPEFDRDQALKELGLEEVAFTYVDGNVAGFSSENGVAVNPLGEHKFRTWVHEAAHGLLHQNGNDNGQGRKMRELEAEGVALIVCEVLEIEGTEYSRGYIQNWWGAGNEVPEESAQRIFGTANRILEAGRLN